MHVVMHFFHARLMREFNKVWVWVFCRNEHKFKTFFSPSSSHAILVFFKIKHYINIPTMTPKLGRQMQVGLAITWLFSVPGYRIDDWWSANNCDSLSCILPHTPPHISESLFITTSMDDHREEKRTEFSKSEAEVTNNWRLHSTSCTVEAKFWQWRRIARPLCESRAICYYIIAELFCYFLQPNIVHKFRWIPSKRRHARRMSKTSDFQPISEWI